MKQLNIVLLFLVAFFAFSCKSYYKTPHKMEINTHIDALSFNLQAPNIFKALKYEVEVFDEENNYIKAYKFIEYDDMDAKLYFEASMPDSTVILNTYILHDKNYYIDRDKYPEEIEKEYLFDLEAFTDRIKGGKYPNRP